MGEADTALLEGSYGGQSAKEGCGGSLLERRPGLVQLEAEEAACIG